MRVLDNFPALVVLVFACLALVSISTGQTEGQTVGQTDDQKEGQADDQADDSELTGPITLNQKASGYRGIWYMNQPCDDEYVYKYSGGLGTYCAKHRPFAIYSERANKTFFCYGGAKEDDNQELLHMVSYFDHSNGFVPRPTILLDKKTGDAHDNPVISIDEKGHLWVFSTSHGKARPSFIHRSKKPFDIGTFELVPSTWNVDGTQTPFSNFSYMQVWRSKTIGFSAFLTRYGDPAKRTIGFLSSDDGVSWNQWQRLAAIDEGHYQISGSGRNKLGSMFNYHPNDKGLNWRTNLYFLQTSDNGKSWETVDGEPLEIPITKADSSALVRDYESENLIVYLKDLQYDDQDRPVLLYITSKGYQPGPQNNPRTWTIARWSEERWIFSNITNSDNNYDLGELCIKSDGEWCVTGPTEPGPQPFNPGGEVVTWASNDQGATWTKRKQLTAASQHNHTYVRNVLNAHPDFVSIWADGHGRKPSASRLFFADADGNVFQLPQTIEGQLGKPIEWKSGNLEPSN